MKFKIRSCLKNKEFQHRDTEKRVTQSIDIQFYFLCVTQTLCTSVLKIFM